MNHVIKFQAPFERLKVYNNSPYVSLFKAIITQAIIDATNVCDSKTAKKMELEAKKWIFNGGEYFSQVCLWAEIEPSCVVKITKQLIEIHKNQTLLRKNIVIHKNKNKHNKKHIQPYQQA